MKIQIKSIYGNLLFEGDFSCLADAVSAAVKAKSNLSSANLSYANLSYADLRSANLSSADLRSANLRSANLRNGKNISTQAAAELTVCPQEGNLIGWKKCADGVIAKMLIPAKARRTSATSRKCRAEWVKVLALFKSGKAFAGPAETTAQGLRTIYAVGKITRPDKWDDNRWNECSNGIHFFITRTEAENY